MSGNVAGWKATIDALRISCQNVRNIALSSYHLNGWMMPKVEVETKKLLISYGTQLRRTDLQEMPITTIEDVLHECPYVRCDYRLDKRDTSEELYKFAMLVPRIQGVLNLTQVSFVRLYKR